MGRLRVLAGGAFEVEHLDLATGQVVDMPAPDPSEDFGVLGGSYQSWIIEPELVPLASELRRIQYEDVRSVLQSLIPAYRRCFDSGLILRQDLIDAVRSSDLVTANDREKWVSVLERP